MQFNKELLRKLREQNNLTQRELAKMINMYQNAISEFENGKCNPSIFTLFRLAYIFDYPMEDFIKYSEDELPDIWGKEAN